MSVLTMTIGAALLASFHCEAGVPRMLVEEQGQPVLNSIGLPQKAENRSFDVRISADDPLPKVEVTWPDDGMYLARHVLPAFETADGSYAFTGFSHGPCLFTDKGCLSQFSIVDRGDQTGKADLLIVPTALSSDKATKKKMLMAVIMRGECQRTDLKK